MVNQILLTEWQTKIQSELLWSKVEEIPGIPFLSFQDAQEKINTGDFATGIDFSTANQLAKWRYGDAYRNFFLFFASAPLIIALLSIILSFSLNNYWLLFGIILCFIGQFTSNPYNVSKRFYGKLALALTLLSCWSIWINEYTIFYLTFFYVLPFWMNRWIYGYNQKKLEHIILKSEQDFIYLYQKGKLGFQDRVGKSFWNTKVLVEEMEDLIKKHS